MMSNDARRDRRQLVTAGWDHDQCDAGHPRRDDGSFSDLIGELLNVAMIGISIEFA